MTKKYYPLSERLKSIKFIVFFLVFAASCVFLPLGMINGTQFVSLMALIVGIFTAGHEHSKRVENDYNSDLLDKRPSPPAQ